MIAEDDMHAIEFHVKNVHDQCHVGITKPEYLCNKKFPASLENLYKNSVEMPDLFVGSAVKIQRRSPSLFAKKLNQRFKIALIGLKSYSEKNEGYK